MITAVIQPGIDGYSPNDGRFRYEIDTIYALNQSKTGWIMEDDIELGESPYKIPMLSSQEKSNALHPLDHVGIDTCSARSVSTERDDFLFIDKLEEAVHSVELNGVCRGK